MNYTRCIKFAFFLGLLLAPGNQIFARILKEIDEDALINTFFKNLYDFSFHEADSIVWEMNASNMDKVSLLNIKANLAWWKLLSGDRVETNVRTCDSIINEVITSGLKTRKKNNTSLLNIIYAYSLKARLENYRGNSFKSLLYFYKSITYIKECIDDPQKDDRVFLVLGLYYYFVDYIEHEYFIVNAIFFTFPRGDKDKGLRYLSECSHSQNEMIRTEANYFLFKIYAYTEKDYSKAYINAQILIRQHPKNLIYSLEKYKLLINMKKENEAQVFQENLINEIQSSKNINTSQKNHFISQIIEITSKPVNQ